MTEKAQINTKELQKFYDVWGPMIASLPAVISASERHEELGRHVKILEDQRDAATKDTEARKAELAAAVEKARAALAGIAAKRKESEDELRAAQRDLKDRQKKAEAAADAAVKAAQGRVESANQTAVMAEKNREDRIAAVNADVEKAKADGEAEIAAIDARRASAQKALDKLRASIQG